MRHFICIISFCSLNDITNILLPTLKFFFTFIHFLRDRETEHKWGGAEREGDRIRSRLQVPSCQRRALHRAWTHKCEIMTWAKVRCLTNWATQVPLFYIFLNLNWISSWTSFLFPNFEIWTLFSWINVSRVTLFDWSHQRSRSWI